MEQASDSTRLVKTAFWSCEDNLSKIAAVLVILQLLAAPAILLRDYLPPTIGVGWFSLAFDFRYLAAVLFGVSLSLPALVAFLLAWSDRSVSWRILVCATVVLVSSVTVIFFWLAYLSMTTVGVPLDLYDFLHATTGFSGILAALFAGVACFPLFIRTMRGWRITLSDSADPMTSGAQRAECALFGATILFALVASPFVSFTTGFGPIFGVFGIFFGMILSLFVFQLFRDQSDNAFFFSVGTCILFFGVLPLVGVWLGDYSHIDLLPAGSGIYFVGLLSGSIFFFAHLILLRMQGYRIRSGGIKSSETQKKEKPVVDPFSD